MDMKLSRNNEIQSLSKKRKFECQFLNINSGTHVTIDQSAEKDTSEIQIWIAAVAER